MRNSSRLNVRLTVVSSRLMRNSSKTPGQILQPPANHAMDGRDGPILDDAGQRLTLLHIQLGGVPRELSRRSVHLDHAH